MQSVVRGWNSLPRKVAVASTLEVLEARLDGPLAT